MSYFPLKNNSEKCRKLPHPMSYFSIENNSKPSRKIYYNSLRVINGEFSQHTSMSCHLSPFKNNSENSKNIYIPKLVPQL
jgi:hypothetical protein